MKLTRMSILFAVILFTFSAAFAQTEMNSKGEPVVTNEQNKPVSLKKGEKITRGAALAKGVKKSSVEKAFASPDKVAGKTVEVSGVIVRSCKKEGCWMEMADKEGGKSVRVISATTFSIFRSTRQE